MLTVRNQKSELPSIDNLFNQFFGTSLLSELYNNSTNSNVNITENDNSYNLSLTLPGFSKQDINIEINDDILSISSEVKKSDEIKNIKYIRKSFTKSSFKNNFKLPEDVDKEKILANMENGILNITLTKLNLVDEKPKTYKIEIN